MTDNTDSDDVNPGDNVLKNERVLGNEARAAIRDAERLFNKHDKLVAAIHAAIVLVGQKLLVGRDLYEFDNNGFADWVTRNKLDQGRIFGRQQERTAAMTIYRLVTFGYVEEEETGVPTLLDLTDCHRARPADIIDWARKNQPMLFDDLRARKLAAKNRKQDEDEFESDEVGDLGGGDDVASPGTLPSDIKSAHAMIRKLETKIRELYRRFGVKPDEDQETR